MGLFNLDSIINHVPKIIYISFQKRGNMQYELSYQLESIKQVDSEVLQVLERKDSKVIVYRIFDEDIQPEDASDILLKARIIKKKGVLVPEPWLHASFNEKLSKLSISDININNALVNDGYGSMLLGNLIQIAKKNDTKEISGWISRADYNHIDRLVHFYKKHDFEVGLYNESNSVAIGDIVWRNNSPFPGLN